MGMCDGWRYVLGMHLILVAVDGSLKRQPLFKKFVKIVNKILENLIYKKSYKTFYSFIKSFFNKT